MTPIVRHRLTEKDTETLTAHCSVCGFVAIRKSGTGYQCAVKKAQAHKTWAGANPQKAAVNRRHRSEHLLTNKDRDNMTARCQKCGDVKLVPWGRGVVCGNLAAIRRNVQEASSQGACRECWIIDGSKVWLTADGVCPACTAWDASSGPRPPERRDTGGRDAADLRFIGFDPEFDATDPEPYGAGFSIAGEVDPYDIPEHESAVRGWKTLGSRRPWNEA